MHLRAHAVRKRVRARLDVLRARACTDLYEIFLVLTYYLMSLSLNFHKDPFFRWGDIQLLVTMYIWYYTLNYSQFLIENFYFFGTPSWKCFYIFSVRSPSLERRKRTRAFLSKNEPGRSSTVNMIWWHSASRDVPPEWFQPYMSAYFLLVSALVRMWVCLFTATGILHQCVKIMFLYVSLFHWCLAISLDGFWCPTSENKNGFSNHYLFFCGKARTCNMIVIII